MRPEEEVSQGFPPAKKSVELAWLQKMQWTHFMLIHQNVSNPFIWIKMILC